MTGWNHIGILYIYIGFDAYGSAVGRVRVRTTIRETKGVQIIRVYLPYVRSAINEMFLVGRPQPVSVWNERITDGRRHVIDYDLFSFPRRLACPRIMRNDENTSGRSAFYTSAAVARKCVSPSVRRKTVKSRRRRLTTVRATTTGPKATRRK